MRGIVSKPGWIEFKTTDSSDAFFKALAEHSGTKTGDRSMAILGGTILEDCLRAYIESQVVMKGTHANSLFDQVLDSFGHQIRAAYVFALIGEPFRNELDLIRQIRNAFAHKTFADAKPGDDPSFKRVTFDTTRIKAWCSSLKYPNQDDPEPEKPRERFESSVCHLALDLWSASTRPMKRKPPPLLQSLGYRGLIDSK